MNNLSIFTSLEAFVKAIMEITQAQAYHTFDPEMGYRYISFQRLPTGTIYFCGYYNFNWNNVYNTLQYGGLFCTMDEFKTLYLECGASNPFLDKYLNPEK